MTCGIYILLFSNTDKVYIGQSVNIEKRFKEHIWALSVGRESPKMQEAFAKFGHPVCELLCISAVENLNSLEYMYIKEFNAVEQGFNTALGAVGVLRG